MVMSGFQMLGSDGVYRGLCVTAWADALIHRHTESSSSLSCVAQETLSALIQCGHGLNIGGHRDFAQPLELLLEVIRC